MPQLELLAPLSGAVIERNSIPDAVFAVGAVGPGAGIEPFQGGLTVVAPCAGEVVKAMAHAYVIQVSPTIGVLVHLGIDTVTLDGQGFTPLARTGQRVEAGQPLTLWNTDVALDAELPLCCPLIVMGAQLDAVSIIPEGKNVEGGKPFLRVEI